VLDNHRLIVYPDYTKPVGFKAMSAMIQSTASSSTQTSYGFENLSRFGPQAPKQGGSGSSSGASVRSEDSKTDQTGQLTPDQQRQVDQLKQTDRKVRQHEQAHLTAGRDLVTSGPNYTYQTGPDKQRYAVGGEVSIDTSPGRNPEETIPKAEHIRATALAPADPSSQDQSVAAKASSMESAARIELAAQERDKAAAQNQGTARLYRGSEQGAQLGGRLDFFA